MAKDHALSKLFFFVLIKSFKEIISFPIQWILIKSLFDFSIFNLENRFNEFK